MLPQRHGRRRFLKLAAQLSAGAGILAVAAKKLAAEEPFDSLPPSVWRHARNNGLVMIRHPAPGQLSWRTEIVGRNEAGQPLTVSGQVFAPDGQTPAAGVTAYAYNTDADGYYGENRAEYPPRLYGWMKTDSAGRFELRTILPGHYPQMNVPAHIHFSFWGGGYPLQWVDELRFEGDRYLTAAMLSEDAARGQFRTIQKLASRAGGRLACDFAVKLQSRSNFT